MTDNSTPAEDHLILRPILFVDDSKQDLELAKAAFERCEPDTPIITARDADEAMHYLGDPATKRPAAIVTDMKMPRMDGFELARWIKSHAALKHIPVIMFTSSREKRDVAASYREGLNAYVVKPVRFADFVETLCSLSKFWQIRNTVPE